MDIAAITAAVTNAPIDWIVIGVLALLIGAETLRAGSNRACSLALALPLALLLTQLLGSAAFVSNFSLSLQAPLTQAGIFIAFTVGAYFLTNRIIGFYGVSSGTPIHALVAGIATAAIILVFWLQVPSLDSLWHFGPQVQAVFGAAYRFWWLLASYTALAIVRS